MNSSSEKRVGVTTSQLILTFTILLTLQPVVFFWILPSANKLVTLNENRKELQAELDRCKALLKEQQEIQPRLSEKAQSFLRPLKTAEKLIANRQTFERLRNSKLPIAIWNIENSDNEIIARYKTPPKAHGYFQIETSVKLEGHMKNWKVESFKFPIIANGKGQVSARLRNQGDDEFVVEFIHFDDDSGWEMKKSVTFDKPRTFFTKKIATTSGHRFKLYGDSNQIMAFRQAFFYRPGDSVGYETIELSFDLKEQSKNQWTWLPLVDWNDPKIDQKMQLDFHKDGRVPVKRASLFF